MSLDIQDTLSKRGLLQVCEKAQWERYLYQGREGWAYPIFNMTGKPHSTRQLRWRSADGNKPKFSWVNGQPSGAKYYYLGDLKQAIKAGRGTLYIAFGDLDMLTFQAAGIQNVLTWFGELSVPDGLIEHLELLGVENLKLYPDCDSIGMQTAWKVWEMTDAVALNCEFYRLPYEMGSKKDTNDLWIDSAFDALKFKQALVDCPPIPINELALYNRTIAKSLTKPPDETIHDLWIEYIEKVKALLGTPVLREGHVDRWLCPLPAHTEKHPSFRISYDKVPHGWPNCSCGIQDDKDAWQQVGAALGIVWQDYLKEHTPQPILKGNLNQAPETIQPAIELDEFYSIRSMALHDLSEELQGVKTLSEPILMPFSTLHQFEGMCEVMWTGKLIFTLGVSGGGKTSFMETNLEKLLRDGYDAIVFGPEWTGGEYAQRSIHRNGDIMHAGISNRELDFHKLALWEQANNVEPKKRRGQLLPEDRIKGIVGLSRQLQNWPGEAYYLQKKRDTTFDMLLEMTGRIIEKKRQQGRRVPFLFWDYIDRTPSFGKRDFEWLELVAEKLKTFCMDMDIVGWVFAQPRKDDSQNVRDGKVLDASSARNLSDNQCNLYLTLNLVYEDGRATNRGIINVVKNSTGKTGQVEVFTDLQHLAWIDKEVQKQTSNLNGGYNNGE